MAAKIVHDDDVAGFQRRHEELFDIGQESAAVDRPIEHAWGGDPIGAKGGEESQRSPAAARRLGDEPLASLAAAMGARHVGLGPALIDEDHAGRTKARLMPILSLTPVTVSDSNLLSAMWTGE